MSPSDFARAIRADALRMVHAAKASHIGTCLSLADILACLYTDILRVDPSRPDAADRDRLIVSKGHGAAIVYAALAHKGFFDRAWLKDYCKDGSPLAGHVSRHGVPGVEASTGSLGHGLPIGCGLALGARRSWQSWRTFVLLSDGELDEGSNWEAFLFAPQHGLDNLTVIIDYNKIQSFGSVKDVLELEPLKAKIEAFRWSVREVDGHDLPALRRELSALPWQTGKPSCLIAHTIKGKGVSFMENSLDWHYKNPDAAQLEAALSELGVRP